MPPKASIAAPDTPASKPYPRTPVAKAAPGPSIDAPKTPTSKAYPKTPIAKAGASRPSIDAPTTPASKAYPKTPAAKAAAKAAAATKAAAKALPARPPEPKPERIACEVTGATQSASACNGVYLPDGMFAYKTKFKNKEGAIIFFDKGWKINASDDLLEWVYHSELPPQDEPNDGDYAPKSVLEAPPKQPELPGGRNSFNNGRRASQGGTGERVRRASGAFIEAVSSQVMAMQGTGPPTKSCQLKIVRTPPAGNHVKFLEAFATDAEGHDVGDTAQPGGASFGKEDLGYIVQSDKAKGSILVHVLGRLDRKSASYWIGMDNFRKLSTGKADSAWSGTWLQQKRRAIIGHIAESTLTFADKSTAPLIFKEGSKASMRKEGQPERIAELSADDMTIKWAHGEVWIRSTRHSARPTLRVSCPGLETPAAGVYKLVPSQTVNGHAFWLKDDRWYLFTGATDGRWYLSETKDAFIGNADGHGGKIRSSKPHGGEFPESVEGWERHTETGWVFDGVLRVLPQERRPTVGDRVKIPSTGSLGVIGDDRGGLTPYRIVGQETWLQEHWVVPAPSDCCGNTALLRGLRWQERREITAATDLSI